MNIPITRAAGEIVSGLADKATAIRDIKSNPPTQVTIADLFHKKLYNFVDFDFLIKYLKTNGIAECKDIHTINTLAKEVVPSLTESALKARDVRKINATYAGIMRLCRRHRKGMLAYLSVDGHAQVCLIKSWDRFLQFAGFDNAATADKLTFNTVDVFPSLRINKALSARIAKYNERAIEERQVRATDEHENVLSGSSHDAMHDGTYEYQSLETIADTSIEQTTNDSTTRLFNAGEDIDFAQLLAMNYTKVCDNGDKLEWDDTHASDYFLYFLVARAYPEYKSVKSVKEFLTHVMELFSRVDFMLDAKKIQQLSDGRLNDLKNALKMHTVEKKAEVNKSFDQALLSLAVKLLVFEVDTSASYQEIYLNELTRIQNRRQQLSTTIRNKNSLIRVPTDDELAEYTRFEPNFLHLINSRNEEIFKGMWAAAVSGKLIDLTDDGFDKIACLLVYDKTKESSMTLAEFDNAFILTINELLPEVQIDWENLFVSTSNEFLKICRIVRNVRQSNSSSNATAKQLLCQAVSKFYGFKVGGDEMWQQLYMGICSAKNSAPKTGLTVTSAADALGLVGAEEFDGQEVINNVMADLDDMEFTI